MLQLSSFSDAIAAVEHGRDIAVQAYTLGGRLMDVLESCAKGGAHVRVTLEEDPAANDAPQLRRRNATVAAQLRSFGVDVSLKRDVHSKTVTVDGTTFFDGSNWRRDDVILRGDAHDAAAVASLKSAALHAEGAMLENACSEHRRRAIVETETFDRSNVVSKALREMAVDGLSPRLLVNGDALRRNARELACLKEMVAEGVEVRVCSDTGKFALTGDHAWLGSANATAAFPGGDMTDWGVVTDDPAIVAAVRDRLEARWASAKEWMPQESPL